MFAKRFHHMVQNFYYAIGGDPAPGSRYYSPRRAARHTLPEFRGGLSFA